MDTICVIYRAYFGKIIIINEVPVLLIKVPQVPSQNGCHGQQKEMLVLRSSEYCHERSTGYVSQMVKNEGQNK